ncbi:MAG: DUF488 domain-containing protein [Myxococcales bacterium]|nr:DUF488 domain-containing protein [Myxococcales bacterium]
MDAAPDPTLFSLGYGQRDLRALVEQLRAHGVHYVVDVRSSTWSSHRPEFCREALRTDLGVHGLRYVYMGDQLGGRPSDPESLTDGRVDYRKVRNRPFFAHGLDRLQRAVDQGYRLCLLCAESDPTGCHRARLIGPALAERGIDLQHLLADGTVRPQSTLPVFGADAQLGLFSA